MTFYYSTVKDLSYSNAAIEFGTIFNFVWHLFIFLVSFPLFLIDFVHCHCFCSCCSCCSYNCLFKSNIFHFSSRHGVIFETVGSLLSLLRTGTRDAYRLFFIDAMIVVEGKKQFREQLLFN